MKKIAAIIMLCAGTRAVELYVFSRDGQSAASTPRELPSVGQPLDDPRTVVVLHAATDEARAACGWYRWEACTNRAAPGMMVSNRWVEIAGTMAYERKSWKPRPAQNFEISKYLLVVNLAAADALAPFVAYLEADPMRKIMWDAAVTLDNTNAMVQAAATALAGQMGEETVSNLMWRSRAR